MLDNRIDILRIRIGKLAQELRLLQVKIDGFSESDEFAAAVHRTKYVALDRECLELYEILKELEEVPALN